MDNSHPILDEGGHDLRTAPHDPEEFGRYIPATPDPPLLVPPPSRTRRIFSVVSSFVLGQGAAQGLGVLGGIYLVRTLSVEAYAQFGIVNAFQAIFAILVDLGFASTIIPLVGTQFNDPRVLGKYVRAARSLRNVSFLVVAPIAVIAFLVIVHKRHWGWPLQVVLIACILISLYTGGIGSIYSSPLFIHSKLRDYYIPQALSSGGRLLAFVLFAFFGALGAGAAASLGTLALTYNSLSIRKSGLRYMEIPKHDNAEANKELFQCVMPAIPAILFSAVQSQLSLFLISIFGGTIYIAEVTALSRLGQLFGVMMTFCAMVVEPHIARLSRERVMRHMLGFVLLACLACTPFVLAGFLFPDVFLLLLGSKYAGVRGPVGWYVLASAIGFIAGLIWVMNRGRKWIFWSGSIIEIGLIVVAQLVYLAYFGIRTTQQAVMFSLVSSCAVLLAHLYVATLGTIKDARSPEAVAQRLAAAK